MNDIQSSLFEAMKVFRNDAIKNSNGTLTIDGIITKIKDAGLGEYYVKYLENEFIAYASANVTYSVGDNVYILVPDGDFTKNKLILGMTNSSAAVFVSDDSDTTTHFRISDNLINIFNSDDIIKMSSYEDTVVNNLSITDLPNANYIEMINRYAEDGHRIYELTFSAKTKLAVEQQNSGNYGVSINIPLIQNSPSGQGVTDIVWKTFTLDTGNMLGDPYRLGEWTPQSYYFIIDDQYKFAFDFDHFPTISYFCRDFQHNEEKTSIKDVWIKDIGLYISDQLQAEELDGYYLKIKASEGNYWFNNSNDIKTLSPILKVNGKETALNESNTEVYWFREDASIKLTTDKNYCKYGGLGWFCLNTQANIITNPDGTSSWDWFTKDFIYEISREYDVKAVIRIKCVIIYNGQQISNIIELRDLEAATTFSLYSSTGTNIFLKDTGYVYLTAVYSETNITESDKNLYQFSWLRYDKNDKIILDEDEFFEIVKYNEYEFNTEENKGSIITEIRFPVNAIDTLNRVVCTVRPNGDKQSYYGSESIVLTTSEDLSYNLIINNDGIIYKYDSNGDSPAGIAYDGPSTSKVTAIAPLTYTIRKIDGTELTKEEYSYVKYKWIIPKKSLFVITNNITEEDDNYYYISGYDNLNHNVNLSYKIANRYNLVYSNKLIRLEVEYQGNILSTTVDISFIKDGQNGTNGTQFAARLVYGGSTPSSSTPYGAIDDNGIIQKFKICYEQSTGNIYRYTDNGYRLLDEQRIFTRAWRDGIELTYNTDFQVEYTMFDKDICNPCLMIKNVNNLGGVCFIKANPFPQFETFVNILQAKVTILKANDSVTNSKEIIYCYYPIECASTNLITNLIPVLEGGFSEVMYASDGTNPSWDETEPFKLTINGFLDIENITSYFTLLWTTNHHLDIDKYSEDNTEVIIKPHNKYDDGNSKNYVQVDCFMKSGIIPNIQSRINALTQRINIIGQDKTNTSPATGEIGVYRTNQEILKQFATYYIPGNWLEEIEIIKPFLKAKFNYYTSLDTLWDMVLNLEDFLDYDVDPNLDFSDLHDSLNILEDQIIDLTYILERMYKKNNDGGTDYNDLYTLWENKIPWDQNIKEEYINNYGLQLALQLESLIISINDQIDTCDRLENAFINLEYQGASSTTMLLDEDTSSLTDEDAFPLAADPKWNGGVLTDEDQSILTDEDATPLMDDATITEDYLALFKSLYVRIANIFEVDYRGLFSYYQTLLTSTETKVEFIFSISKYTDLKNIFNILYDEHLKGVFIYNKKTLELSVRESTNNKINSDVSKLIDESLYCQQERNNLQKIVDNYNSGSLSFSYIRPIVLYFNRYELSNINAWDGNKIDTGDGTYLLAPQVGAGVKNDSNTFTGIVMGQRNLYSTARNINDTQVGLFGYNDGKMSLFLNARNGSAVFGEAGQDGGGQVIIDPAAGRGMIYSSNFWTNYGNDLLPSSYSSSNESGNGMLIDFTNGIIRAKAHRTLNTAAPGFFLDEYGLSIGEKFFVDASDGSMRIGAGAVANQTYGHFWEINTRPDNNSSTGYESYIIFKSEAHHGNEKWDPERLGQTSYAQVYIGTDGISLGNSFSVDKEGNLRIGSGSIGGDSIGGWWIHDDFLASNNYETSSPYGSDGIKLDSRNNCISLGNDYAYIYSGQHNTLNSDEDGFYLSNNGLSIGDHFYVDEHGYCIIGNSDDNIRISSNDALIHFNDDAGMIYSGSHSDVLSTTRGFYLGPNGLSIGDAFQIFMDPDSNECIGKIGGSQIMTVDDDNANFVVSHSNHAWKLRSAPIDSNGGSDIRFYTYMTANKHLIVSNDELKGHRVNNDVTPKSTIGSISYPWHAGYFENLRINEDTGTYDEDGKHIYIRHDVIPEGLPVILLGGASNWETCLAPNGDTYYQQTKTINGMSGNLYLYIATETDSALENVFTHTIDVDTVNTNEVTFIAKKLPTMDIPIILLVEDFIYSHINPPVLNANFDQEKNQLYCNWDSPRDSSKFITWLSDELVIEHCIDEAHPELDESWEEVLVVPQTGEDPFKPDEFSDDPLIIGSSDEGD